MLNKDHDAGRRDYLGHRQWNPPQSDPGYERYSRGWAEGRALLRGEELGLADAQEIRVDYPSGHYYHAWDQVTADRVIRDAGGGTQHTTGRTLADARRDANAEIGEMIERMKNDLAAVRRRLKG